MFNAAAIKFIYTKEYLIRNVQKILYNIWY